MRNTHKSRKPRKTIAAHIADELGEKEQGHDQHGCESTLHEAVPGPPLRNTTSPGRRWNDAPRWITSEHSRWCPPLPQAVFESRYAPRDWERYLHGLYYGKVYYWLQGVKLQPVKFDEYLLAPSWYSNEKHSKRFVTTVIEDSCPSILDLVPTWRAAWRSYPRALLLMGPR